MHDITVTEPIVVEQPLPGLGSDGEVRYGTFRMRAAIIERRGNSAEGTAAATLEFLVPGKAGIASGSRIIWRGATYEVGEIRLCRDLDGELRASRCFIR